MSFVGRLETSFKLLITALFCTCNVYKPVFARCTSYFLFNDIRLYSYIGIYTVSFNLIAYY